MAEAAAITTIVKSALPLLSSLAKDESLLLWKSGKELKRLKDTIETISYCDTDKLQSQDQSVQKCLSRLRDAMYDAEEFFDALHWRVLHKKTMGESVVFPKEVPLFFSKSNQLAFIFKTAHQVKSLRESLDSIKADMELCHLIRKNPPLASDQQVVIRHHRARTHSFVSEKNVIGRDQDRDRIINMLLPPSDQGETSFVDRGFSIVAVIGFGGLGKTTVAQLVYNDERVKSSQGFEVCLWACINYFSDLEQVLIEIIASKEGRLCNLGLEKLQEKLREIIGGRKFIVVIDDVWDEEFTHWASLETILDCGKIGSKVLVTTRSQKVAQCLRVPESCRVNLEVLSDDSAWSLFVKKAFLEGELIKHPELEPLGREIVRRCANVPLSIIVIGSLVGQKPKDKKTWSNFLDSELGKSPLHSDGDNTLKNILMVSYNNLLPNVKPCFASCSLFRKGRTFYKDHLIRLWLSQGFLMHADADNEESLEELGEKCFFHLVERCFFQEVEQYVYHSSHQSGGNNRYGHYAKMDDFLHDMARDVAKTEFICLPDVPVNKCQSISYRHISVGRAGANSFDHYCSLTSDQKRVKTLLLETTPKSLDLLLGRFKMLRTLNLSNLGITRISDYIGELIHLRYLDLSENYDLKHLPNSICNLHLLMILNLARCNSLESLPPKMQKLVSLRQLYIKGCSKLYSLPSGLATLTSLVNLDRLVVHPDSGGLGYLSGLDNLRGVLEIELPREGWANAIEDAKRSNMSKKHKLEGMEISWTPGTLQEQGRDEAKAILEALQPHKLLEQLDIRGYGGAMLPGWFCMLENLKDLCLTSCNHVEYLEDEIRDNVCFPSLEKLRISGMRNLKGWWRQEIPEETNRPCLPKVSSVRLSECPQLKGPMPLLGAIEDLNLYDLDARVVKELLIPNPNLKYLSLCKIKGLICLPEGWIRHLTALQGLSIVNCSDLRWVSRRGLSHLEYLDIRDCMLENLKHLHLASCNHVEYLEDEIGDNVCFPSLERLEIWGMRNLKGWRRQEIPEETNRPCLPKVSSVHLEGCPQLKGPMPLSGAIEDLYLKDVDGRLVKELLILNPNLKRLSLYGIEGLSCLPEGWIRHLTALQSLKIEDCSDLRWVSRRVLSHLNALEQLTLVKCEIGEEDDDDEQEMEKEVGMPWKALHSLRSLKIGNCTELYVGWKTLLVDTKVEELEFENVGSVIDLEDMVVEQPTQLRHLVIRDGEAISNIPWKSLASLRQLRLYDIRGMEQLPDGIQHLTSLGRLSLWNCGELRSVPNWIPQLTSLSRLDIGRCSQELRKRCEKERGEDWPLIRHIPDILINYRRINEESQVDNEPENEAHGKIGWCGLFK